MADPSRVIKSEIIYLDPAHCDSTAGYAIVTYQYKGNKHNGGKDYETLSANVTLTDCNRKISWEFDFEQNGEEKIDKIIDLLKQFKRECLRTERTRVKKVKTDIDD